MPDLRTLQRWVVADWRAHKEWRREARENFAFVAGDQWTDEERQILEDSNRPAVTFNRAATIINAVAGSEINNRTEVRYFPRTLGDAEMNEVLTKGAEWFRDQAGAEEEDSQAFHDALVCGLGWTETLLDFEEDADGQPSMQRINPLEMCWDGSAERRGLTDARRFARVRKIPLEEARELFPDASDGELHARWFDEPVDGEGSEPTRQWSDDDYSHTDDDEGIGDDRDKKEALIIQLQYCQRVREVEYADPQTGERKRMGKRKFERFMGDLRQTLEATGMGFEPQIQTRDVVRKEWRQVFIGGKVLEENQPCADCATFVPVTGYWDNAKRKWYGLLASMKDPQKWANKWLTQTLHIINSNSKGGVMVETGAVDDPRRFEEDWAAADAVHWLKDGALGQGRIQEKTGVQMPAPLMQLTEFAITSIRDVSGVNQELLGLRDQNQPGVLEYQRKQAAMTTLAGLFDALRQYRKQQGKVLLFYMTEYLADGRLVRIADEDGARYAPLVVDEGVKKYDVIVDDAPTSPNNKEKVWETIVQLMPLLEKAGLPKELWAEIISYSPFPEQLIEKFRDYALKPQQPDPKVEAMFAAELEKTQSEAAKNMAAAGEDKAAAIENIAGAMKAAAEAQGIPQQQWLEMVEEARQLQETRVKGAQVANQRRQIDQQGELGRGQLVNDRYKADRQAEQKRTSDGGN